MANQISADLYDQVYSYFKSIAATPGIAATYTTLVFQIASQTGSSIDEILKDFKSLDPSNMKMTSSLAYLLNSNSTTKTLLHGVIEPLTPNMAVLRNVIQ